MTAQRLLVLGASGGLGTTVLATVLAARAGRRGHDVMLVESTRGALDVVTGVDGWAGLRLDDLTDLDGRPDARRLLEATPAPHGVRVLAHSSDAIGPPLTDEQQTTLLDAVADVSDVLVVDGGRLRPGIDRPSAIAACDHVVVVIGEQAHQLGLAVGVCAAIDSLVPSTTGLHGALRGSLDPDVVAARLELDDIVIVPHDAALARTLAAAELPGRSSRGGLARAADRLLDACDIPVRSTTRARAHVTR